MEDAVKLRKTGKSAGGGDIRNLIFRIQQQELTITDPYQMNILGDRIAGNSPELVGQVKRIHIDIFRQFLQGEVVHVMSMDIIGYGINPLRQPVLRIFCLIDVKVMEILQVIQELGEQAVYHEFISAGHFLGAGLMGQRHNFIQNPYQYFLLGFRETEDGHSFMKWYQKLFIGLLETVAVITVHKGDHQPLGGSLTGIKGLMQAGRLQQHEIIGPDAVGNTFNKMCGHRA